MSAELDTITPAYLRDHRLPEPGESKKSRGTVLVVGGSVAAPGAVLLSGLAALRVGAGVLTLAVDEQVAIPLAVEVPEAGVRTWRDSEALSTQLERADSVLVGPGLDDPGLARHLVLEVIDGTRPDVPVVLDAYALGVLPDLRDRASTLADRLILTPNGEEARRLLQGETSDDRTDQEVARAIARRWSAVVVYQGLVATAEAVRTVATGHGGLGTSGSGDVLAGAAAGILARGADPHLAACWATYLHAAAGDRLAARIGRLGFLARELVGELPALLTELSA